MFNSNVINILSQMNSITNTAVLKYPTTVLTSSTGDIMVYFDVSVVDDDGFDDIGIFNMSEFLNTFKLFSDDRIVRYDGYKIDIADKVSGAEYIATATNVISNVDKDTKAFDITESVPTVSKFKLSGSDLKKIKQATGVFSKLPKVIFKSQDGEMKISLGDTNNFNAKSNSYGLVIDSESTKDFEIRLPVENLLKIPNGDYTVHVKHNATKNAFRILLHSDNVENLKILMSVEK